MSNFGSLICFDIRTSNNDEIILVTDDLSGIFEYPRSNGVRNESDKQHCSEERTPARFHRADGVQSLKEVFANFIALPNPSPGCVYCVTFSGVTGLVLAV